MQPKELWISGPFRTVPNGAQWYRMVANRCVSLRMVPNGCESCPFVPHPCWCSRQCDRARVEASEALCLGSARPLEELAEQLLLAGAISLDDVAEQLKGIAAQQHPDRQEPVPHQGRRNGEDHHGHARRVQEEIGRIAMPGEPIAQQRPVSYTIGGTPHISV